MNYEVIAQWSEILGGIAFVIVAVWLFRTYLLPAVRAGEVSRNKDLVTAERRREELRAEVEAARAQSESAGRDAEAIASRAQADAQREHDAIVADGRREAARLLVNAQGELERGRIAARDQLRIEFIERALVRARELATAHVDTATNTRLIEKTVDDLAAGKGRLMPNETLARRYATAVFQLASEAGAVPQVSHDLHTFVAALAADADVDRFFRSPVIDRNEKATVITQAFSRLHELALHTILVLVRKRREALAPEIVEQFDRLEREARGAQTLHVVSARPLDRAELDAIVAKLGAVFQTPLDVTQTVEPDVIGGVRLTVGDKRIDGTIAGRLDDLARMLSTN